MLFQARTPAKTRVASAPSLAMLTVLIAIAAIGVFLLQNAQDVPIRFLWFEWDAPAIVAYVAVALASLAMGAAFVVLLRGRGLSQGGGA